MSTASSGAPRSRAGFSSTFTKRSRARAPDELNFELDHVVLVEADVVDSGSGAVALSDLHAEVGQVEGLLAVADAAGVDVLAEHRVHRERALPGRLMPIRGSISPRDGMYRWVTFGQCRSLLKCHCP